VGTGCLQRHPHSRIAESRAASRVEQRLDGGVGVRRRVMDLRDIVHRRDPIVELAQAAEQLVDVHVSRAVHGGEFEENELEISCAPARRARPVVDEPPSARKLRSAVSNW
jgi:hypothetical protein